MFNVFTARPDLANGCAESSKTSRKTPGKKSCEPLPANIAFGANAGATDIASHLANLANQLANVRAFNFRLRVNRLSIVCLAAGCQCSAPRLPSPPH